MRLNETELQMAERHVRAGKRQLERQRKLIAWMEVHNHSTQEAERLLANLDDSQRLHLEHLARLRAG